MTEFENDWTTRRNVLKTGVGGFGSVIGIAGLSSSGAARDMGPPNGGGGSYSEAWTGYERFRDSLGDADRRFADMPEYLTAAGAAVTAEEATGESYDYDVTVSSVGMNIIREENYVDYDEIEWDLEPIHSAVDEFGVTVEMPYGSVATPVAHQDFEMDSGGGVGVGVSKFEEEMVNEYGFDEDATSDEIYDDLPEESKDELSLEGVDTLLKVGGFMARRFTSYTHIGRVLTGLGMIGSLVAGSTDERKPPTVSNETAEYLYESPYGITSNMDEWIHHVTVTKIAVNGTTLQIEPYIGSVQHGNEWSFEETIDLTTITY